MEAALRRIFGALCVIVAMSLNTPGSTQTAAAVTCAFPTTAEGVCPIVVDNHATCATVAAQAHMTNPVQAGPSNLPKNSTDVTTTPPNPQVTVHIDVSSSGITFKDNSAASQQRDTPGVEAVIVAGASTGLAYFRTNWVTDTGLTGPGGSTTGNSITFCWSQGACTVDQDTVVAPACNAYNPPSSTSRTADILQAIKDASPLPTNICGCPPNAVRLCDPSLSSTVKFSDNIAGVCNPTSPGLPGGNLDALQAESTVKTGTGSCVIKQIGGTYYQTCF
jgi:hypothetical protein